QFSPYDYWQFWRNTDDRDVKRFLNFFTEIEPKEIDKIVIKEKNINNLKILLANEATKILHGETASNKAEQTARDTFAGFGLGSDLPQIKVRLKEVEKGINFLDFISNNKILASKSETRRALNNKGFKINDIKVVDEKKIIELKDFKNKVLKLSFGKKKHYLVKII
ncbi:MAG: tyrosine--tRNA ligase, partial [Pelagibacteraceae bacterium]|nr:tyrosine--tRNA ligase [Pelagibacteraceae bacterium]